MAYDVLDAIKQGYGFGQGIKANRLANALTGQLGQAGFDPSTSVEFQQLSAIAPERAANIQQSFSSLDKERQGAFFTDMRKIKDLVTAGEMGAAVQLLSDRHNDITRLGGDTSDTDMLINTLNSGDMGRFNALLDVADRAGVEGGFLAGRAPLERKPFQRGEGALVFDPNTGAYSIDPVAQKRLDFMASKKEVEGALSVKDKQSLNKDITGFIKNAVAIRDTANDLDKLSELGTGPAAIAAVFKFMKANDPTSTVREGEFATAEQSTGVPAQVRNFYNKLLTGERMKPEEIKQFVQTSKVLANSAIGSASTQVDGFLNTFGDDLGAKFDKSLRARVPQPFRVGEIRAPQTGDNFTSSSGITFTVK